MYYLNADTQKHTHSQKDTQTDKLTECNNNIITLLCKIKYGQIHSNKICDKLLQHATRQSEMENTSPRHMPAWQRSPH